jgi:aminoglycoside phosphotransferase (APT) family kinase protein
VSRLPLDATRRPGIAATPARPGRRPAGPPASPPGLDLDALRGYLDAVVVGGVVGPIRAELIEGGRSNLTYLVTDSRRALVVRRPPLAHLLPTAHDMRREYTVQRALGQAGYPVPPMLALCTDDSVIGAPFYVMEWVPGHVVRTALPAELEDTPLTRRRMSEALVTTLVRLHALDPQAVGLGELGHPEGFLGRQVRRWWQQWLASRTRELPAMDELHSRLEASVPAPSPPAIVHGDYRLDNVIFAPADPSRIAAVVDWEMSTIGDPLCDLGLLLVYWAEAEDEPAARSLHGRALTGDPGFLRRPDIIAAYRAATGRDLSALDWYVALGAYKLAVILEGIAARFRMGMTVGAGFESVGAAVPAMAVAGLEAISRWRRA